MGVQQLTTLEHIRVESQRRIENAGVKPVVVKVFPNPNRLGELVILTEGNGRIAHVTLLEDRTDLSFSDFSVRYIEPAVARLVQELTNA
jgi:hypothetical protein